MVAAEVMGEINLVSRRAEHNNAEINIGGKKPWMIHFSFWADLVASKRLGLKLRTSVSPRGKHGKIKFISSSVTASNLFGPWHTIREFNIPGACSTRDLFIPPSFLLCDFAVGQLFFIRETARRRRRRVGNLSNYLFPGHGPKDTRGGEF